MHFKVQNIATIIIQDVIVIQTFNFSIPHTGQNLWFTYNTIEQIDTLIKKLHPQGYRESQLKEELKKRYDELTKGLNGTDQTKK